MADVPRLLFGTLVSLSSMKHFLLRFLHNGKPKRAITAGTISGIYIYPVKSCAGIAVEAAEVTHSGLVDKNTGVMDRHFMVVNADTNNFISQRQEPSMAMIKPRIDGSTMHLDAPGMKILSLALKPQVTPTDKVYMCRVWGDNVPGLHCGKEAQEWLSSYLKRPAALMYAATTLEKRDLSDRFRCRDYDDVVYQDWGQVLCISEASLFNLNQKLPDHVKMENFRPNFVVDGCPPHDEDSWNKLYIGNAQFTNIKLCGRCILTTVDPNTGVKNPDGQPLKTLKAYRKMPGFGNDPCFGINVFCDLEGTIKIGNDVDVTRSEEKSWF